MAAILNKFNIKLADLGKKESKIVRLALLELDFRTIAVLLEHDLYLGDEICSALEFFEIRTKLKNMKGENWVLKYLPSNYR